jgi:multicomponent Na+:H+ antiporter subunit D
MAASGQADIDLASAMVMEPTPLADWLVIAPIVYCLMVGAGLMMLRKNVELQPRLATAGLFGLVLLTGGLLWHVIAGGTVTVTMGRWLPPFGISFTADVLGAVFAFTSALVALACGIFGAGDVDEAGRRYGFYSFLFLMMAGVTGAFLTGDIFNLYVWFEVLLIASFGLQVLGSSRAQLDGATKYAFLNLVATTLFLIATGFLYGIMGTLNMADIAMRSRGMDSAPLLTLSALYLLAFGMKAAAFPVNFWLPASYHTPKVVVSALFAGLLTKVGIYALLRTLVMLFPEQRETLAPVIAVIAMATMILGALGALAQTDFRRLLGYLVVSGIGIMLAGIALASAEAISGAVFYALHSIIVMTALYMAAGFAARIGRSFSIAELGGLYGSHVFFAALTLMLFFSVSGLPPFSGFWPKAILVKASIDAGIWWLGATILVTGFLTTIACGRVWILAYWHPAKGAPASDAVGIEGLGDRNDGASVYAPLIGLVALTAAFGLYPETLLGFLQEGAAQLIEPAAYIDSVFPQEAGR